MMQLCACSVDRISLNFNLYHHHEFYPRNFSCPSLFRRANFVEDVSDGNNFMGLQILTHCKRN